MPNNITRVVALGLCVSCGTCASVCERHAIVFHNTGPTEPCKPRVLKNCNFCGRCLTICPGYHNSFISKTGPERLLGPFLETSIAYSLDREIRYQATSGGLISTISLFLLRNHIVDYIITVRMSKDRPLIPEPFFASEKADVEEAMGSKYCPVSLNLILKKLDHRKRYAYVGLPCHIQGLKNFLKLYPTYARNIIFCFGLFCSRTPSFNATKFLLRYNHIPLNRILSIKYRGNGHPGSFQVTLKGGRKIYIPHLAFSNWGYALQKYFMQYRCWFCDDKTAHLSDISFGDDWTIPIQNDSLGRSNLIIRSQIGKELLNTMKQREEIELLPLSPEKLIITQELRKKCNIGPRYKVAAILGLPRPIIKNNEFEKVNYQEMIKALKMLFRIKLSSIPYPIFKLLMKIIYRLQS